MNSEAEAARRAHALLTRAMELPPEERRAFVRAACRTDEGLGVRVLELLDAGDRSSSFLSQPAVEIFSAPDHGGSEGDQIPDAVGDYLVVGVLGSGGMATVYEAIQESPRRRVALKVMHQSMARTDAYLRFKLEAETLARLSHPGIAQIYEVGAARLGGPAPVPFFAMELVQDAVPITQFVRRERLGLRERVRLFTAVCEAVLHGHQHGVIHRDLKPANILVDAEGRSKIIDFGVARAAGFDAEPITIASGERQLVGTLNYMSPEQCGMAADIDTRTDIYSLGVVLYQLVYDRLPRTLEDRPLPAALHAIMHEPAERPGVIPPGADRDLEAVIFRAIERDPDRRYEGVSAFAADLRRWLCHEPTTARPSGMVDQARLFARRNRGLVATGLAISASVVIIATISTVFAIRLAAEVERRRAAEIRTANERDVARWQAYTAQIAGALAAMKTGEFHQMRTRLADVSYADKGWEWGFLSALSEQSQQDVVAHNAMVVDMAMDPGATRLATVASDGAIRLWDAATLDRVAEHQPDRGIGATAVRFSRDGEMVLAGYADGSVVLLDAADLDVVAVVASLGASVRAAVELRDGRIAVANAAGETFGLRTDRPPETAGGLAISQIEDRLFQDQPGGVQGIEPSPDGATIATYNDAGSIWIREPGSLRRLRSFEFPGQINQARFSADGRLLAAAGAAGRLMIWDTAEGTLVQEADATGGVNTVRSLAFSPDGTRVALGLIHRGILIYSLQQAAFIGELGGHTEAVSAVCFTPDDRSLVSASWDGTIRVWGAASPSPPAGRAILTGHEGYVRALAFSPDGFVVASASRDRTVRFWQPDLAAQVAQIDLAAGVNAIDFSPDGQTLAAGCSDGLVRLLSVRTGQIVGELRGHSSWISAVAFDAAGRRVAAGADDGTVRVWDTEEDGEPLVLAGHAMRVNSVRFAPDGSTMASGSRDGTARLWNCLTGEVLHSLDGHRLDVFAVLFHPSGDRLYTGSRDQTVRVWDTRGGVCTAILGGHGQIVTSLALNPDATRLAAGSWYGEVVLFDVDSAQLIASFRAHESAIRGVAFSPDGRWLASGSYDRTVRLFDSATRDVARHERDSAVESMRRARALMPDRSGAENETVLAVLDPAVIDPAVIDPAERAPEVDRWLSPLLLSRPALTPP